MTNKREPKREPPGLAWSREACARLHERGEAVTTRAVLREVAKVRGVHVSFRSATPAVQQWRADWLARTSGRIDAAVGALLALETDDERDAVRRAVAQRSGGGVRVKFTVASRATRGTARQTPLRKRTG
jgi:hypothetical protein